MHNPVMTWRDVGADDLRPQVSPGIYGAIEAAAAAVGRWAWIRDYERAEAVYWPAGRTIND